MRISGETALHSIHTDVIIAYFCLFNNRLFFSLQLSKIQTLFLLLTAE